MNLLTCTSWISAETILFLAEPMRNNFISDWVNAQPIFVDAQPAFKFWQFLHGHPDLRSTRANKFHHCLSQRGNYFSTDGFNTETIFSLTGSTRKRFYRWLVQRGNKNEPCPGTNFAGPTQSSYCIQPDSLSLELGICELLSAFIHSL